MKYKFRLSETNYITITKEQLDNCKDVVYTDDGGKGKVLTVTRYDGKNYQILAPLDMLESED